MSNPFRDQEKFMQACDQSVGEFNEAQYQLYCNLISEEFNELVASKTKVDDLDALIDILVVTIGAIHSLGADAEGAWKEVMRTNFAKIENEKDYVEQILPDLGPEADRYLEIITSESYQQNVKRVAYYLGISVGEIQSKFPNYPTMVMLAFKTLNDIKRAESNLKKQLEKNNSWGWYG